MTDFKIGDVVRLKDDSPARVDLIVRGLFTKVLHESDREAFCVSDCGQRILWARFDQLELVNRPDPQADLKQAIREVLLSDEFIEAFTKKAFGAKVEVALPTFTTLQNVSTERSLEHPIPGVNRPMRNDHPLAANLVGAWFPTVSAEAPKTANVPESPNSLIESPKRYREPTQADLANGPVCCEVRDWDSEQWKARQLIHIHKSGLFRFLCKNESCDNPLHWSQCRIEVAE